MATPAYNGASVQKVDTDGTNSATSGTLTASAGSNRFLLVLVCAGAGTVGTHNSVAWGGAACTQRGSSLNVGSNGRMSLWYLKEANFPASATGTVVANFSTGQDEVWIAAVLYSDVDQTNPFKNASLTTNTGAANNSATITVTSDATCLVVGGVWGLNGSADTTSIAISAGTSRQEVDNLGSLGFEAGGFGDVAGGASNATTSWTFTMAAGDTMNNWGMVGDALQLASGGGGAVTNGGFRSLLGVGK